MQTSAGARIADGEAMLAGRYVMRPLGRLPTGFRVHPE